MNTWHLHIEGRVQGVGFRPFVYRLAKEKGLVGTVANTKTGVHIYVNAKSADLEALINQISSKKPAAAEITAMHKTRVTEREFDDFSIIESGNGSRPKLLVTPDIALCDGCREELHDATNRRHKYAFTTCTQCGPRYSIMQALPYDRKNTTMQLYTMCPVCKKEYENVRDGRFYSQTNSCPQCGVSLFWLSSESENENAIAHVVTLLQHGKIVAAKGIGGFLLLVDATNAKAIKTLRQRKNRPSKPFAVLFPTLDVLSNYARISPKEQKALQGPQSPIVLLQLLATKTDLALQEIAPELNRIGAMLPYAPLLELISAQFGKPLVATSANASGSPIVYTDKEATRLLSGLADAILSNDREIAFPLDDSVVAFTSKHQKKVTMRRARGCAPSVPWPDNRLPNDVLAFGAEMKSAFAFTSMGNIYLSQFLGDTAAYESQVAYNHVFTGLTHLIQPQIKQVVVDAHPDYHTATLGKEWANYKGVQVKKVQHHHAHFAAVLAENNLLNQTEPVLGVVWDGTGYGTEGQIWGSEIFVYCQKHIKRINHLKSFPHLFNNRMSKEPNLAAVALLWPENPGKVWMRHHFSEKEYEVLIHALENSTVRSTSMGRLFDAVAALLNVSCGNSYEGEAALALQVLAENSDLRAWKPFCLPIEGNSLDVSALLHNLWECHRAGATEADLAMRFHQTLVQWVAWLAATQQVTKIAFSGGVFQNTLLVDLMMDRLSDNFELYFHQLLPPNDENIAVGQIAMTEIEVIPEKEEDQMIYNTDLICV